jgi:integrase
LPRGVFPVKNGHGVEYFYFQRGRGTKTPGPRVGLGKDTTDPKFWGKLREAQGVPVTREGTWGELIAGWRKHNWERLRPASRKSFGHFLDRLDAEAGDRLVAAVTSRDIYALLDGMSDTPNAANFMLSVLRLLLKWAVKRGYRNDNPAIGVDRLKVEDSGHAPWPEDSWCFVMEHAPLHLRRMAFLGRVTGQRISDLVKMRPADLAADGINVRIGKLRDRLHFVPLTTDQMRTIKSWGVRSRLLHHDAAHGSALFGDVPQHLVEQLALHAPSGAGAQPENDRPRLARHQDRRPAT